MSIEIKATLAALVITVCASAAARADPAMDVLVAAYPDFLTGYAGNDLQWKDGTRMPISDGKEGKRFQDLLDNADIKDQFAIPYRLGNEIREPRPNEDPGRIRSQDFFVKMYGDCRKGEVLKKLKSVPWLPNKGGGTVLVTTVNGVADRVAEISNELEKLPDKFTRFLVPSAGAYNCRDIAGTKRLSIHSFGAAIDLSTKYGDYWLWSKTKSGTIKWTNRFPGKIIEVFERHGFIWGGKWYHFDTFHFEYRPEIIELAKRGWPKRE